MRIQALMFLLTLASCQQPVPGKDEPNQQPKSRPTPTWKYAADQDRIRKRSFALATLGSVQGNSEGPTAMLGIQQMRTEGDLVWFKVSGTSPRCYTTCGIAYDIDGRAGTWSGENAGEAIALNHSFMAIDELKKGRKLIVELNGNQFDFDIKELKWATPPENDPA